MLPLAYKSTAAVASALQKGQTATALLTRCKVYAAAFVSVVSAVCLVRFLTFVSNLSKKSNNEQSAHFVPVVSMRVDTVRGVRFSCLLVASCICLQSYNLSTEQTNKFAKIFS